MGFNSYLEKRFGGRWFILPPTAFRNHESVSSSSALARAKNSQGFPDLPMAKTAKALFPNPEHRNPSQQRDPPSLSTHCHIRFRPRNPDALVFISSSRPTFRRVPDEESTLVWAAAAKRKRIHVDFTPAHRLLQHTQAGAIVINNMDDSDMDYTEEAFALDGDYKNAVNKMRESYNIFKSTLGPQDKNTLEAEHWFAQLTSNAVSMEKRTKAARNAFANAAKSRLLSFGTVQPTKPIAVS
ncbi:hypothetical protein OQA88_9465 [Cercophora sp. LCS_1]